MAYTTIDDPSEYFTTLLYTGNATDNRNLTNDANAGDFKPDWLWLKERSSTSSHQLVDSTRGSSFAVMSDSNALEDEDANRVQAFQTNGFQIGTASTVNQNTITNVAWQWKANGGTATATISESGNNPAAVVQANPTAGFSIISYTGTGSSGTIAHGLGAIPEVYIIKNRDAESNFEVFTNQIVTGENSVLRIDTAGAKADSGVTLPTSSVITVTQGVNQNGDGVKYIMYVFKNIQGYSKTGSYVGNGNADGTFVYTGFKPAWVMIKRTSGSENWVIWDNKRDPFNNFYHVLLANATSVEDTSNAGSGGRYVGDFLSNGFKLRNTHDTSNSSSTYVYLAFAERPFVTSEGVPTTAR